MAGGWTTDGAVQEQIDSSLEDAVARARSQLPAGDSLSHCEACDWPARRNGTGNSRRAVVTTVVAARTASCAEGPACRKLPVAPPSARLRGTTALIQFELSGPR